MHSTSSVNMIKLMEDSITEEEIDAVNDCLRSGQYTQWDRVQEFEQKMAAWNGTGYGVMVNSGSSANLLIVDMLKKKYGLQDDDEVLVPCVTWPTTVYPIIQHQLTPAFCDVDKSFNLDVQSMERMISLKTKAVFVVHLLGQSANLSAIQQLCRQRNLVLVEDCCESLGAVHQGIKVGNFGVMGSISFYFGHHMTTFEGGMILTNDFETADLLKSTRSHGWVKRTARAEKYRNSPDKDFLFDTTGYNVRSTDLNAAVGLVQLRKLDNWVAIRRQNHQHFIEKIKEMGLETQQVTLHETSSFCLPVLFSTNEERNYYLQHLPARGVETRPIVAGNLLRQPVFSNMLLRKDSTPLGDLIHTRGIYLPNNQYITSEKIDYMLFQIQQLREEYENEAKEKR